MDNKIIVNNRSAEVDMARDLPKNNAFEAKNEDIRKRVIDIAEIVEGGGYDPVSQLSGFILSEDPTHIANYNGARAMASHIDRDDLLEDMIRYYLGIVIENDDK